jgi:hypothetical protein
VILHDRTDPGGDINHRRTHGVPKIGCTAMSPPATSLRKQDFPSLEQKLLRTSQLMTKSRLSCGIPMYAQKASDNDGACEEPSIVWFVMKSLKAEIISEVDMQ